MSVAVVGAIALDEILAPTGSVQDKLGGSSVYASLAARLLGPVAIASVIGDDLAPERLDPLRERGIDLSGVRLTSGPTFRWGCRYGSDLVERKTLYTEPGSYQAAALEIPAGVGEATHVFLTAGDPDLNRAALPFFPARRVTMLDTIEREAGRRRADLLAMLAEVQILSVNDVEAALLLGEDGAPTDERLADAAYDMAASHGAEALILKRGPLGVDLRTAALAERVPAAAPARVVDPTGAGDSFGGATLAALASGADLLQAARVGVTVASFTVEAFGPDRLLDVTAAELERRQGEAPAARPTGVAP